MSSVAFHVPSMLFTPSSKGDAIQEGCRSDDIPGLAAEGDHAEPVEPAGRTDPQQDALLVHAQTIVRAYLSRHRISASDELVLTLSVLKVLIRLASERPPHQRRNCEAGSGVFRSETSLISVALSRFLIGAILPVCLEDGRPSRGLGQFIRTHLDVTPKQYHRRASSDVYPIRPPRPVSGDLDPPRQMASPTEPRTAIVECDRRIRELIKRAMALGVHDADVITLLLEGIEMAELRIGVGMRVASAREASAGEITDGDGLSQ
ncbi:MucR family transcriptional regulator [Inquilinus limosus]